MLCSDLRKNSHLLDILVEHHVALVLDELAGAVGPPQGAQDGGVVLKMVGPQHALHVLGGLLRVVEGHLGEQVVAHVSVGDVVQRAVQQEAEGPVHCAQGTAQPRPKRRKKLIGFD